MVSKTSVPLASPCAEPGATSQHRGRGTFVTQRFSLVLNSWSLLLLCADVYEVRSHSIRSPPCPTLLLESVSNPGMAYPRLSLCFEPPTLDASIPRRREPARRRFR